MLSFWLASFDDKSLSEYVITIDGYLVDLSFSDCHKVIGCATHDFSSISFFHKPFN